MPDKGSGADRDLVPDINESGPNQDYDEAAAQAMLAAISGVGKDMAMGDAGKLEETVDADMKNINFSNDWNNLEDMIADMAHKSESRLLAVIDCPTSKVAVIARSLDRLKTVWTRSGSPRKCRVLVTCHARFELVAQVQEKALDLWPEWRILAVQVTRSKFQSAKVRPNYVVVISDPSDTAFEIPTAHLLTGGGRKAHRHEHLLLRCTESGCRHRRTTDVLNEERHFVAKSVCDVCIAAQLHDRAVAGRTSC